MKDRNFEYWVQITHDFFFTLLKKDSTINHKIEHTKILLNFQLSNSLPNVQKTPIQ